jgi:hypothetical protein
VNYVSSANRDTIDKPRSDFAIDTGSVPDTCIMEIKRTEGSHSMMQVSGTLPVALARN